MIRKTIDRLRRAYWSWRLSQHGILPVMGGAMTKNERQLKAVEQEMERRSKSIQEIWKKAQDEDDRDSTAEEREEIEKELKAIEELKSQKADLEENVKVEAEVKRIAGDIKDTDEPSGVELPSGFQGVQVAQHKSIGEQFVESEGYKSAMDAAKKSGGVPQDFSTGNISLDGVAGVPLDLKGTLLEGAGAPGAGTGGGLLPVPQVQPGVQSKLFQRLTVADLIPQATTGTNTVRYVVEGTATSGAAGVPEGGTKPESTLALSTVDEPVKKIATALTVSEEMLEDAAQTQGYINGRLSLFVQIEDERQLVLGGGTNELVGITGRNGVTTYARGTVDSNAVALFKAMNGQRGSSFLEPSAIIMNPANWQTTRLATDTAGQFFGGGPFQGPYSGNGDNLQASGQVSGALDNIWGKPVVVTTAVGAGTALVGAFDTAAQIFRRHGITVEASNQHANYFIQNLVAIRAEERLALAVYRPAAFTLVTGLN